MAEEFTHDVFLSYSVKDKAVVHALAERLRADGLRVWLDDWMLRPGDLVQAKIEEGLEHSRVLVLCMSASAFGSDWVTLESQTFRFKDPLNKERRFIPLRLDDTPIKSALSPFLYINWLTEQREQEYAKLLEACRPPSKPPTQAQTTSEQSAKKAIQLDCKNAIINDYAFSSDGKRALTGVDDNTVRLWDMETGRCLRVFEGQTGSVQTVAWSVDQRCALSGSRDSTVRLWDVETGRCLHVLEGHTDGVRTVAWSAGSRHAFSGDQSGGIQVWHLSELIAEAHVPETHATTFLPAAKQVQYTNAKVLLVGESGAGKTGLTERLAHDTFTPSYSTSGTWSTQWQMQDLLPEPSLEHDVWLWDFGGQADQRLIHQLYLDKSALILLVFNADRDAVLPGLREWHQALARSVPEGTRTYLVAGRTDVGFRFDREKVRDFARQHGYEYFETSAFTGQGCPELRRAI